MKGLLAVRIEGRRGAYRIHKQSCPVLKNPRRYWPARSLGELRDGYTGIDCQRCGGSKALEHKRAGDE